MAALLGATVFVPVTGTPPAHAGTAVERVWGADRYGTSVALSQKGWPAGAPVAVLVGGRDQRDMLAATGLAGVLGQVPVLQTPWDFLRDDVRGELQRLGATRVVIVGGEQAVAPAVEAAVRSVVPNVTRYAGADAYDTAAVVARDGFGAGLPGAARGSVFVVNPFDAAAGASAGWLAAGRGVPVLLVPGDRVPASTQAAIDTLAPSVAYAVGGPNALTDALVASLPGGRRVAGADGWATSVEVAGLGAGWDADPGRAVLAAGFNDAVSAAAYAGHVNAPLLLTPRDDWHGRLADWFRFFRPSSAVLVGGDAALDPLVAAVVADGGEGMTRGPGSSGAVVGEIQQRLLASGFHASRSGVFDFQTQAAVWALQKAFGLPVNGVVGEAELQHLRRRERAPVLRPDITDRFGDHVEISIGRQLVQVVRGGAVEWSVHTSTGKPSTPTITGLFRILDHRPGFNASHMYMTMHFSGGYAIHGYDPVPLYPASHGCARVIYADAELLYAVVPDGMPVIVWR